MRTVRGVDIVAVGLPNPMLLNLGALLGLFTGCSQLKTTLGLIVLFLISFQLCFRTISTYSLKKGYTSVDI